MHRRHRQQKEYGYRADERFMMLSSFKLLACALVLHRVDSGTESLERNIAYSRQDLLPGRRSRRSTRMGMA